MKCPTCQKVAQPLFQTNTQHTILQCPNCTLAWTQDFTPPDYTDYHRDETYITEDQLFTNIFTKLYLTTRKHKPQPGNLLEIGSSSGNLLDIFYKHGWQVTGIEPSTQTSHTAKQKGYTVHTTPFEQTKLKPTSYDAIIINHTLEHVDNPHQVITKIHTLLKPGGFLLIGVPNFGSLSSRIYRQHWEFLLPLEHKWHFTPQSLTYLLKQSDFTDISYQTTAGLLGCAYPLQELTYSLTHLKKRFITNLLHLPYDYLTTQLNLATNLLITAHKP